MPAGEPVKLEPAAIERIAFLQAKISELQYKADRATDEDIKEGFNLEVIKLGMKVARLQRGFDEELPSEVERTEHDEEELEPLPKPTLAELTEADSFIQRARLEKTRGNLQGSTDFLKKAAEIAPGAAPVLEALGDDLAERKQYAAAHEVYKRARRADPNSASIERKYAALAMYGKGGMSIEEQIAINLSDAPLTAPGEEYASPRVAALLNWFIPGLGHFVLGYPKKGLTIFLIVTLSISIFFLLNYMTSPASGRSTPPGYAYFFIVLAIVTYIAGIMDTMTMAKKTERKHIDRPVPPVNKPFE